MWFTPFWRRASHAAPARVPFGAGRRVALRVAVAGVIAFAGSAQAQPVSREEALTLAFPGATFTAERVFLTADQQRAAAVLAGRPIESALVARYIVSKDQAVVGRAYVDTHVVRTKKESLLISLTADGRVKRIDVTAFLEPPEYRAPSAWIEQYGGRALGSDLEIERAIRPLAGATLTARTTNDAVRRVLAIDRVLQTNAEQVHP